MNKVRYLSIHYDYQILQIPSDLGNITFHVCLWLIRFALCPSRQTTRPHMIDKKSSFQWLGVKIPSEFLSSVVPQYIIYKVYRSAKLSIEYPSFIIIYPINKGSYNLTDSKPSITVKSIHIYYYIRSIVLKSERMSTN